MSSWHDMAGVISQVVVYLKAQFKPKPKVEILIIVRNDATNDQLIGGTLESLAATRVFLERALTRLREDTAYEALHVIDRRTGKRVKGGKA